MNKYILFILSNGRPNNIKTIRALKNSNYTGEWRIICDNEDNQLEQYRSLYGDKVIIFDKLAAHKKYDTGDNMDKRNIVLYARNECFDIARTLGYTYFIQFDDDYTSINYKITDKNAYCDKRVFDIDSIFAYMWEFYVKSPAKCIAFAQHGDYQGGGMQMAQTKYKPMRKVMNSFMCSTERPFLFVGRVNEDVNMYTSLGSRGDLFLTIPLISIKQMMTQQQSGGLTAAYLDGTTYAKSWYSVMYHPSGVKIASLGKTYPRFHHKINWDNTYPCIIRQNNEKTANAEPRKY